MKKNVFSFFLGVDKLLFLVKDKITSYHHITVVVIIYYFWTIIKKKKKNLFIITYRIEYYNISLNWPRGCALPKYNNMYPVPTH